MTSSNVLLLKIKEQISENLSSAQISKTLDDLLFNCLRPVICNTNFIEYVMVELLPHIFLNQRRKFSNQPLPDLRDAIFSFIMADDDEEKTKILRKQNLERSVYFAALSMFAKAASEYLDETEIQLERIHKNLPYNNKKLKEIRQAFYPKKDFYETSQSTIYWLNNIYRFRAMIVEKYIRHAYVESKKMAQATDLDISQDDLFRDLIISIHKAIDKYDVEKGTLTNYINLWFMEAKTSFHNSHEYGVAYKMPTAQRKKLLAGGTVQNFTMELNEAIAESVEDTNLDVLENLINTQNSHLMNNIACHVDTDKLYVLTNGIEYTLNKEDLQEQEKTLLPVKVEDLIMQD